MMHESPAPAVRSVRLAHAFSSFGVQVVVAIGYVLGALLGFALVFETWVSAIWPPSGISLAAVLIGGYRLWPAIIAGSLIGNFVGLSDRDAPTFAAVAVAGGIAVGNALQALVGAYLVRRFCRPAVFDQTGSVLRFVVGGALLSTTVSTSVGVGLLTVSGLVPTADATQAWSSWWLGNVMSDLVCAPLILAWRRRPRLDWRRVVEGLTLLVLIACTAAAVFGVAYVGVSRYPLVYLPLPLVGWAALRFGQHGATAGTALLAAFAISGTVGGRGVFVQGTMPESLFLLQTFLGIVSVTALALAATVNERTQKEAALSDARDQLENRVAERTAELRALSTRLESVREDERRHIAREIHDELGQILTALKIDLFWVQKRTHADLHAKLAGMVELTESMIRTVRRIATELRPGVLDHLGLIGTLEWQAEDFEARTGVVCNLDMAIDNCPLDGRRSTEVFRMVQEALTNVARHAGASQVDFRVHTTAAALVVEVSDDGQGFSPGVAEQGRTLGLVGMRERAARCGGTIEFGGGPGHGTTVRIEIPLNGGATEGT